MVVEALMKGRLPTIVQLRLGRRVRYRRLIESLDIVNKIERSKRSKVRNDYWKEGKDDRERRESGGRSREGSGDGSSRVQQEDSGEQGQAPKRRPHRRRIIRP